MPLKLAKLKERGDVKGLIKYLKHEKSNLMRATAVNILGDIGDARAVEPLVAMLKYEDWSVRKAAAEALEKIGDPQAVAALEALEEYWVANFPAELLRVLQDPDAILAAYEGKYDNPHIVKAIRDRVAEREK